MEKEMPFGPKIYNSQGGQMFKQKVAAEYCVKKETVWQPIHYPFYVFFINLFNFSFPTFFLKGEMEWSRMSLG
jgi:hypothetical protein